MHKWLFPSRPAGDGGGFDEQRLATAGGFHLAVGQLGNFQFGGDGLGDALEFAGRLQRPQIISE